jgi:hypothetical protein
MTLVYDARITKGISQGISQGISLVNTVCVIVKFPARHAFAIIHA